MSRHHGNPRDVSSDASDSRNSGRLRVEHPLVHVYVDDLCAIFHLLTTTATLRQVVVETNRLNIAEP